MLAVFYFLWAHGPLLASLLCAAAVALIYDRQTRQLVGERIRRYERGLRTQA